MSIDLLDSLKRRFPNKSGQINGWKFEKAHSIIHKVRDIIMFGWSENFSTQGPEHCHIDFCEKVAKYTNNKDVFLTLLKYHVREGHLQFFQLWYSDLGDEDAIDVSAEVKAHTYQARNDAVSCELSISYPVLQSISSARNCQTIEVCVLIAFMEHMTSHKIQ